MSRTELDRGRGDNDDISLRGAVVVTKGLRGDEEELGTGTVDDEGRNGDEDYGYR